MRFSTRWLCATFCVLATMLALSADTAHACGRCGYHPCRLRYRHVYHPRVAVHQRAKEQQLPLRADHSFHVTYFVAFPPPAAAGTTSFAYAPGAISFLDPALFLGAAARYLDTAQLASQKGFADFNRSASQVMGQQANLAELQARGTLLQQAAKVLADLASSGNTPLPLRASRDANGQVTIDSGQVAGAILDVQTIVANRCLRCHGTNRQEAALDLSNLATLDASQAAKILDRITTADPDRRMPQGGTLSTDEIAVFFRASSLLGTTRGNSDPNRR